MNITHTGLQLILGLVFKAKFHNVLYLRLPQKKPLIPEKYEILKNPPSRSAKLRYAIKINENQDFSDIKKKFKYLLDIEKIC